MSATACVEPPTSERTIAMDSINPPRTVGYPSLGENTDAAKECPSPSAGFATNTNWGRA
jgi:hypothetical protein